MAGGQHRHEPVLAERVGLQSAGIHRAGDDAEIGGSLRHETDDLVRGPLDDIDADAGMESEVGAQGFRQELGQRVGVRQNLDLADRAAGIGGEIALHPVDPLQQGTGMGEECPPGRRQDDALAAPAEECRPEGNLHRPDPARRGGERQVRPGRPMRDRPRLGHVAKQAEIDEVETHHRANPSKGSHIGNTSLTL